MYSCESWADSGPFCAGADPCIRNVLDIHTTYGELYYYVVNILISCGRCIAVKVGQMPIHLCKCRSMHQELVGHPRLYQKFVGRPRYVFGIILLCYQYIN